MPKYISIKVRTRPALFSSPHWQDESLSDKTEQWRDQRKKYTDDYDIGVWGDEGSEIIGLLYGGVHTHYAFYLKDILDNPRVLDGIHFDAGTSRTELFVEPDEWKRVLNELNVISRTVAISDEGSTATEKPE